MRGFVGPVGDDIPSIFPIVAGVLLFLGTLFFVNGTVQQKNELLEVRKAALSLSYLVTEKGSMDRTGLQVVCDSKLKPLGFTNAVNFLVTLKRFCSKIPTTPVDKEDAYYVGSEDDSPAYAFCTSLKPGPKSGLLPQPKQAVVFSYPIAVPCPKKDSPTQGLGEINVIAWRK